VSATPTFLPGTARYFHPSACWPLLRKGTNVCTTPPVINTEQAEPSAESHPGDEIRRRHRDSKRMITALTVAAGIGGLFAGCHPTGTPVVDELYGALFAVAVTLIASQASRQSLLVLSACCVAMSRAWLLVPALGAFAVALYQVALPGSRRRMGALVGALASQVILRWPPIGFHGSTALVAIAVLVYPSVSAYRRLSKKGKWRARRSIGIVGLVALVPILLLIAVWALASSPLSRGQQGSITALHDLRSGTSGTAAQELASASTDFATADSTVGAWWTAPLRVVPLIAQHRQALATGAAMAEQLDSVAARQASGFNLKALNVNDGQIDLTRVASLLQPADILHQALAKAQVTMAQIQNPWLVSPLQSRLRSLTTQLDQAQRSAGLAVRAIPVLPAMLGAQAPRHYLVVFETPSEMRGLGGIITGFAELTAVNGKLTLTRSGSVTDLNAALPQGGGTLAGPSSFLARYGAFKPASFFQDETYAPDLPTTGQVLSQLYPQTGGDALDGVVVVDPFGLAQLLKLTGPVKVPGLAVPLNSRNTPSALMEDQYILYGATSQGTIRHDYGAAALQIVFHRLTNMVLPGPEKVSNALSPALHNGQIAMWSTRPQEESILQSLGAAETFPSTHGGDLLAVTLQNAGNNNIDVFLHQSTSDNVVFDPTTGAVQAQLSITLKNTAPSSGLPAAVLNNPGDPAIPPGSNYMWLSVYTPLGLTDPSVDGAALALSKGSEFGVNVYSGWVDVPPESTATAKMNLTGSVSPARRYQLHLRVQPSANPVVTKVSVTSNQAPGAASTWNAEAGVSQVHTFSG
jgi:hypothetical protein